MSDMSDPQEIRELDFSQAHFLDHSLWTCGSHPETQTGGRRRHIAYAWDFLWKPQLFAWTLCRIGRHKPVKGWRGRRSDASIFIACANCAKMLNPNPT